MIRLGITRGARTVSKQHVSRDLRSLTRFRQRGRPEAQTGTHGRSSNGAYERHPLLSGYVRMASSEAKEEENTPPKAHGFLDRETAIAEPGFKNRWAMVVPAFLTHMCIGSPWAWSVLSGTLTREIGVVSAAAADWSMTEAARPMSIVFALQGISAAVGGKWAMSAGPKKALAAASVCFGGGLAVGGLGIDMHSLPLLYLGYGLMAGTGVGIAYTPPVQALIQWFPDKKGLASGLAIAGFGSGALVFTPLVNKLMAHFAVMPEYLGPADQVATVVREGKLYAAQAGDMAREVVVASSADISKAAYDLTEGVYAVGTGTTGAAPALAVCGAIYGAAMLASAFTLKLPHASYKPDGWVPPVVAETAGSAAVVGNVTPESVMKTPQFYLLGTTFFCVACGGMGIFSVAKTMMGEVFSSSLPMVVTAAFTSQYVQMIAAGNLGGRLAWASFSDKFGRPLTFKIFTLASIPLYLAIPTCISTMVDSPSVVPLAAFCASTFIAISCMGGTYSILPAYEADIFGSKYVGPIHGRMLLFSSAAALAGPDILFRLRAASETTAIKGLLEKCDPSVFENAFKAPMSHAEDLIASKTVSIAKLMEIMPAGTQDPSPFIYDSTMYTMAGLMGVAAISHSLVRPVNAKYFEKVTPPPVTATFVDKKV